MSEVKYALEMYSVEGLQQYLKRLEKQGDLSARQTEAKKQIEAELEKRGVYASNN